MTSSCLISDKIAVNLVIPKLIPTPGVDCPLNEPIKSRYSPPLQTDRPLPKLEKYRPENNYVLLIDDSVYTQIIEI